MTKDNPFDPSAFEALANMANRMKDAYADGLSAMDQAGEMAAEDMTPDHEVALDIMLSANIEGHPYLVDATVVFAVELNPVLEAPDNPMAAIFSALGEAGVELGEDADAVMEQLGMPRIIGTVREVIVRDLKVSGPNGPIETGLNQKGTLLVTLNEDRLELNCEGVFTFPDHPEVLAAIPSMEMMQQHIYFDRDKLYTPVNFSWEEPDKDNLMVNGSAALMPID